MVTAARAIADAAQRFESLGLYFGHGTDNAEDEAAFLVLHALNLPFDVTAEQLSRELSVEEIERVDALIKARVELRLPAAYLTHRMWFAGLEFYVDERVLVPRSPLAELIDDGFQPWLGRLCVERVLDIGTGSGCIAVAVACAFPTARIDALDISKDALAVAAMNRDRHGLNDRMCLIEADLFPPLGECYQLIVSNPPYVPRARMKALPKEYRNEPPLALEAGTDGMDYVSRILAHAHEYLSDGGLLVVEVGEIQDEVVMRYPHLPFTWIEFEMGGEGVFLLTREELIHRGVAPVTR